MATTIQPTLKDVSLGFHHFNGGRNRKTRERLPWLTVAESLDQFFELCDLVLGVASLEVARAPWIVFINCQRLH
jgi:hypothetical protein